MQTEYTYVRTQTVHIQSHELLNLNMKIINKLS